MTPQGIIKTTRFLSTAKLEDNTFGSVSSCACLFTVQGLCAFHSLWDTQTDGLVDGHCQAYYLPAAWWISS